MSDKFLSGAALAAAGVAAASLLSARSAQAATPTTHVTLTFSAPPATPSASMLQIPNTSTKYPANSAGVSPMDIQILNFALFVETLEAERYRQSIIRLGSTPGNDNFGNPITPLNLGSGDTGANLDILLVNGFAQTEMQQRDIIATTLYGAPDMNPFLSTSSNTFGFAYDFGINNLQRADVVADLSVAETVGVAAYLGGSGLLQIKSPFLAPAASFLGVEARHAAGLAYAYNQLLGSPALQTAPLATDKNSLGINGADMPLTADAILNSGGMVAPGCCPPLLAAKLQSLPARPGSPTWRTVSKGAIQTPGLSPKRQAGRFCFNRCSLNT